MSTASGTTNATTTSAVMPTTSRTMRRLIGLPSLRSVRPPKVFCAHGSLRKRRSRRCHQPNADTAHAVQVARLCRALAELAPQPGQVHVDSAVGAAPCELPHLAEQVALADDLTGAAGEREQQLELLASQL